LILPRQEGSGIKFSCRLGKSHLQWVGKSHLQWVGKSHLQWVGWGQTTGYRCFTCKASLTL